MPTRTLSELRGYVRTQTETTEGELPNSTIDLYLQEAFNRTIAFENQWPFLEKTWELTQQQDEAKVTLPSEVNVPAITGLFSVNDGNRVELMSHVVALEYYGEYLSPGSSIYVHFSPWTRELNLWPAMTFSEQRQWLLTGFRYPIDWIAAGPDSVPDCDARLQQSMAHYAVALAYAQQEDEQLESVYMSRWQRDFEVARGAIMEPAQDRPLIMGPHRWSRIHPHFRRPSAVVIPPT